MKAFQTIIGVFVVALLTACGGGGGGGAVVASGPAASTLSFPLQSAYSASVAAGSSKSFTISGTCTGSASITRAAAAGGATFEGVSGRLSSASTFTGNYTNCTPSSFASTSTGYYDTNYVPLGSSTIGSNYGVYLTPPTVPSSVMVGATGVIGTQTLYTNSTKAVAAGRRDISYVVEADTASTAIVNLIAKSYNASNILTFTEQDRYRIAATGPLTIISFDVQYANGSTTRLLFQ